MFAFTGWCILRYRRGSAESAPARTPRVVAPRWLELSVAGTLLVVFLAWWVWGFPQYAGTQAVHDDAYEVYVTGKQWMWKFDYPEGRTTAGVLYVPQGRDVRLLITSRDVIHSFFVPDFRLKQDAVPGPLPDALVPPDRGRARTRCCARSSAGRSTRACGPRWWSFSLTPSTAGWRPGGPRRA